MGHIQNTSFSGTVTDFAKNVKVQLFFTLVCHIKNTSFSGRVSDFAYNGKSSIVFYTSVSYHRYFIHW